MEQNIYDMLGIIRGAFFPLMNENGPMAIFVFLLTLSTVTVFIANVNLQMIQELEITDEFTKDDILMWIFQCSAVTGAVVTMYVLLAVGRANHEQISQILVFVENALKAIYIL